MQRFFCLTTSLIFAVHAVLGCSVHHICSHTQSHGPHAIVNLAGHDCHGHDHDDTSQPADEGECPTHSCQHVACSYVKAEQVRIDRDNSHVAPAATFPAVALNTLAPTFHVVAAPANQRILSPTPLYVWHCALVI